MGILNRKNLLRVIPWIILSVFLMIGLLTFDDYGVSVDERMEREYSMMVFRYFLTKLPFLSVFGAEETAAIQQTYADFPDRLRGHMLQWPATIIEFLRGDRTDSRNIFLMRHLLNFLYYFAAVVCFYKTLQKRFKNPYVPLIGLIFLILSPRYYGDSFFNNKDLIFCSFFIISLACFVRVVYHPTTGGCVLLGLFTAAASNVRITGFFVLAAACIYFFFQWISKRASFKTFLVRCLISGGTGLAFYLFSIPAAWENPWKFITEVIGIHAHYSLITPVFFMGKTIASNTLPWTYVPVWMIVSIPVLYSVLFFVGLFFIARNGIRGMGDWNDRCLDGIIAGMFFIPILMVIVLHSVMYSGWRHTYFLYVPLLWIALAGVDGILSMKKRRITMAFGGAAVLSCLLVGGWMIEAHPYQSSYFNILFRNLAQESFEVDPMGLSTTGALQYVLDNDQREGIIFWNDMKAIDLASDIIPLNDRKRIRTQYYGYGGQPGDYIILNHTYTAKEKIHYPFFAPFYEVKAGNLVLSTVYQRTHESDIWGYDVIETAASVNGDVSAIFDGDFESFWQTNETKTPVSIDIKLKEPMTIRGLTFFTGEEGRGFPKNLRVFQSDDGIAWTEVPILFNGFSDFEFTAEDLTYLRLQNFEPEALRPWTISELLFHGE